MSARPGLSAYLAVAAGGGVGALLRGSLVSAESSASLTSLLAVNTAGSLLIGLLWAFSEPGGQRKLPPAVALGLMAGFCGALTSYSTVTVAFFSAGQAEGFISAISALVFSAGCWLVAAIGGLWLGRQLTRVGVVDSNPNKLNR